MIPQSARKLLDRKRELCNPIGHVELLSKDSQAKPKQLNEGNDSHAQHKSKKTSHSRKVIDPTHPLLTLQLKDRRLLEDDGNRCDVFDVGVVLDQVLLGRVLSEADRVSET
jgi:hypothetical protein